MRTLLPVVVLSTALLLITGCTCNRADEARRAQIAQDKRTLKRVSPGPGRTIAQRMGPGSKTPVEREEIGIVLLDGKRFAAGEEDPWVRVTRKVGAKRPVKNAVWMLFKGPTPAEAERGLVLDTNGAVGFEGFSLKDGTATVKLRGGCDAGGGAVTIFDHLVRTLEPFPQVEHVKVLGPDGTTTSPEGPGHSRPACLEP